jgi:hypothetical protein
VKKAACGCWPRLAPLFCSRGRSGPRCPDRGHHPGRRRAAAPGLRDHRGGQRVLAAPVPAGLRAHLGVRDAVPPDPPRVEAARRVDLVSLPGPGPVVAAAGHGHRGRLPRRVRQRRRRRPRRRHHLPLRPPRPHQPHHPPGTTVTAGQVLGVEGSTGTSTGNHLHFEILINGDPVDPVPFMADRGAPLDGRAVAPTPTHPRPGGRGGRDRVRPPARRHPPPGLPDHPTGHHPATVKALYVAAGTRYQLPWTLLAGIGMEETAHGRTTATSSAGARGLMQFMPATFAAYGVDGDGDGRASITSDADSVFSAANYLTRSGVTKGQDGVRRALFAYNHATWYVHSPKAKNDQRRPALRPRLRRRARRLQHRPRGHRRWREPARHLHCTSTPGRRVFGRGPRPPGRRGRQGPLQRWSPDYRRRAAGRRPPRPRSARRHVAQTQRRPLRGPTSPSLPPVCPSPHPCSTRRE